MSLEIRETTGMRLRMHLGEGQIFTGKFKGEKFYLSYDKEGIIVEIKENQRLYFIIPFNSIVSEVLEKLEKQ